MSSTVHLTAGIAFLAGLVSFVSPCVLPLVPAYLSLLTGESLEDLKAETARLARARTLTHAVAFVLGFSVVFVALGLTASAIGGALNANRTLISQIGGVLVVILGLQMMGFLRIPFLMMDKRAHVQHDRRSFWTSLVVGMAFAAGWSPCIGPILAGILALASQQHNGEAAALLSIYSLGLALPFLVTAAAIGAVLPALARLRRYLRAIEFASGAFLVAVGFVLINNAFLNVAGWFYQFVPQPKI
ncbi:MAG TPA: cytochrome c biogenesis protein CcdA [Candidatus Baltobacteraceae bacterium]|jgi:cytochrome c-type biogenesis protein|nr:cytochrome c biogenesis protein CcdA [Candidatus Baltobacteraceae bacterium]